MSDDEIEIESIFTRLRPICVELAKNSSPTSTTTLDRLKSEITNTTTRNPEIWRYLFDYIVFPLRMIFRRSPTISSAIDPSNVEFTTSTTTDESILITTIDILKILIDRCDGGFNRPDILVSLISESFLSINNPPGSDRVSENDRLIAAVIDFTTAIFGGENLRESTTSDGDRNRPKSTENFIDRNGMDKLFSDNRPFTAQIVFAWLKCLKRRSTGIDHDSKRNMQISIVRLLSRIVSIDDSLCVAFLPGVASGIVEFILKLVGSSSSSSDQFVAECLEIWTRLVLGADSGSIDQSDEWRRNSAVQLSTFFDRLSSTLIAHPSTNVRRCLFETVSRFLDVDRGEQSILIDCQRRALEIAAACVAEDQIGDRSVEEFVERMRRKFGDQLEKLLLSTSWRLPRSSRSPLSSQQRIDWQCLLGYIRLLGSDGLSNFLLIDEQKETFFTGLATAVELSPIIAEELRPTTGIAKEDIRLDNFDPWSYRRRICPKSPSDPRAQEFLRSVCERLANVEDLRSILEYLYRLCDRSIGDERSAAVFITNLIFRHRSTAIEDDEDLLFAFLELYLTNLRSSIVSDGHKSNSSIDACLNLEALALCSVRLGRRFQPCLIESFYVVLASLRFADRKDYAWAALFDFAKSLGHESVTGLIAANSDYLASSILLRLRRFVLYPDSAVIFAALLDILGWESIATFRGAIAETLNAIDHFAKYPERRESIAALLTVLERFCWLVVKKAPQKSIDGCPNLELSIEETTNRGSLEQSILYRGSPISSKSESTEASDKSPPLPWYLQTVADILHRIRSWIFADGIPTRLASLCVLDIGLRALGDHENTLLPLIHQTWPSIVARLRDIVDTEDRDERSIVISSAAFRVIVRMTELNGNFVGRRIETEAWPAIRRILRSYLSIAKRANALIYGQNPAFRLQLAILENLGEISKRIGSSDEFVEEAKAILEEYRSTDVLPALRMAAEKSFGDLEGLIKED